MEQRTLIGGATLNFFGKSNDRTNLSQKYLRSTEKINDIDKSMRDNLSMARSYLSNSRSSLDEARSQLEKFNYDKAVREAQESIEFAIKAIFYSFDVEPLKEHRFSEKDFQMMFQKVPEAARDDLENLNIYKTYLYSLFWENFYTVAKYGLEVLKVGAGNLMEKEEAELAIKHASFCNIRAHVVVNVHAPKVFGLTS